MVALTLPTTIERVCVKSLIATIVLGVLCASAYAQVDAKPLAFTTGADVVTKYYLHGIRQEGSGLIGQPWGELTLNLFNGKGAIERIDVVGGIWNSLHSADTGVSSSDSMGFWYEADLFAGVNAKVAKVWTVGARYSALTSPSGAFDTVQQVSLSAAYDDSALWGKNFNGLKPFITVTFETDNSVGGGDQGTLVEVGVKPSFLLVDSKTHPVELALPVKVGLSLNDYYQTVGKDSTFGYASVGPELSVPLIKNVKATAGVDFLFLDGATREINGGAGVEVIGKFGITVSF
jgi:hypothetical protein